MNFFSLLLKLLLNLDLLPNFDDLSINVNECDLWIDLHSGRD